MKFYLDFEKPIVELERKIAELREISAQGKIDIQDEVKKLERKLEKVVTDTFSKLTIWQRTQLSRHPDRPYTLDFVNALFTDFTELHGDRNFADDPALVCGMARFEGEGVMIIGHQKGRSTKEKIRRNFGMPRPEGYRKALRCMSMAERFGLPIFCFLDTPGAYPGVGAEERGQAEAIAKNILVMTMLKTPILSVVIGEGGSGGALAIGVTDRILMLENAIYSVISPEACAAILWRDSTKGELAAKALRVTAPQIKEVGVADEIVPEPGGGAHRNLEATAGTLREALKRHLAELRKLSPDEIVRQRYAKYRAIGVYSGGGPPPL
jgi:acetyl-CoA carboxylase carboxyl transferase subunit alpha